MHGSGCLAGTCSLRLSRRVVPRQDSGCLAGTCSLRLSGRDLFLAPVLPSFFASINEGFCHLWPHLSLLPLRLSYASLLPLRLSPPLCFLSASLTYTSLQAPRCTSAAQHDAQGGRSGGQNAECGDRSRPKLCATVRERGAWTRGPRRCKDSARRARRPNHYRHHGC